MNVGLHNKGVGAHLKGIVWAFFYQRMPGFHDDLVDPFQHLGREQAQVVLERLHVPLGLIAPVAVPEHLAHRAVLVGQLGGAVIVRIQP